MIKNNNKTSIIIGMFGADTNMLCLNHKSLQARPSSPALFYYKSTCVLSQTQVVLSVNLKWLWHQIRTLNQICSVICGWARHECSIKRCKICTKAWELRENDKGILTTRYVWAAAINWTAIEEEAHQKEAVEANHYHISAENRSTSDKERGRVLEKN